MTNTELEKILLAKNGSVKEFPFDKVTAVYKVMNKMFALVGHKEGLINMRFTHRGVTSRLN